MTDKTTLLALADRCEAAPPEQQRELLEDAFWLAFPVDVEMVMLGPFSAMLDCGAFVDAALTMVPEGYCVSAMGEVPDDRCFFVNLWQDGSREGEPECCASTLALAITAAALRAQVEEID